MSKRTLCSMAGLAGAGLLILGLGTLWAQFPPPAPGGLQPFMPGPMMGGPAHGRFVVAHASDKRIVILDTATGKLYQAKDSDLLPIADLPKVGQPGQPGHPGRGGDRERPIPPPDRDKLKKLDDVRQPATR